MSTMTAQDIVETWRRQLKDFFDNVLEVARESGWNGWYNSTEITEDPFGIGARVTYEAPVLQLERPEPETMFSQQITFEPRHRNTIGSAGRIDVYSYPEMHEAMLLRVPDTTGANAMTQEAAEQLVEKTPWTAFSTERMPLNADLTNDEGVSRFLADLVARR
jgi:hypothetical protein